MTMALGGGTFLTQNKVLPGSYLNFVSASRALSALSERGVAAMPIPMQWGIEGEMFTVTAEEFQKNALKLFGYTHTAPELMGLRDLFSHCKAAHLYKINGGGTKAASAYCTARFAGSRGNRLQVVITANEDTTQELPLYDVTTYFDGIAVDGQKALKVAAQLQDNDFVLWKPSATLALTAGTPCTGGTDGTIENAGYQEFLDKLEAYSFHTVGTLATDETIKGLFANWTKRMRDQVGVKFQCVLYRHMADYEGVISVENKLAGEGEVQSASLVYWTVGAQAGCGVNQSLTNALYDGEYSPDTGYTQTQLEEGIKAGKLLFHKVGDKVRMLEDINTFTSATTEKSMDFSGNQTIRVLDQIGNDIAALFNTKYLGQVPNDNAGRISLWNDIVKHHQQLAAIRAIESFQPDTLTVEQGENKKAVVVRDYVTPIQAMAQLYMTVVVE